MIEDMNGLLSVSCTAATFCMGIDWNDNVFTERGGSWSGPETVDDFLSSIFCTSATFCVAVDSAGNALTYHG
jgi:hypothetical protein